jgi:hypothetical protein
MCTGLAVLGDWYEKAQSAPRTQSRPSGSRMRRQAERVCTQNRGVNPRAHRAIVSAHPRFLHDHYGDPLFGRKYKRFALTTQGYRAACGRTIRRRCAKPPPSRPSLRSPRHLLLACRSADARGRSLEIALQFGRQNERASAVFLDGELPLGDARVEGRATQTQESSDLGERIAKRREHLVRHSQNPSSVLAAAGQRGEPASERAPPTFPLRRDVCSPPSFLRSSGGRALRSFKQRIQVVRPRLYHPAPLDQVVGKRRSAEFSVLSLIDRSNVSSRGKTYLPRPVSSFESSSAKGGGTSGARRLLRQAPICKSAQIHQEWD